MTGPEMGSRVSSQSLDAFSLGKEPQSVNSSDQCDEDLLEQFFSDEEPTIELGEKETVNSVIKRVSKRSTQIIKAVKHCQALMDSNAQVIKRCVRQGRKPDLELKRDLRFISDEFLRVSELTVADSDRSTDATEQKAKLEALQRFAAKVQSAKPDSQLQQVEEDEEDVVEKELRNMGSLREDDSPH